MMTPADLEEMHAADDQEAQREQAGATRTASVNRLVQHRRVLLAEVDRLIEHSQMLNTIGWRIATTLGDVPEGAEQIEGKPVDQADRLIAEVVRLRIELAMPQTKMCLACGDEERFREEY